MVNKPISINLLKKDEQSFIDKFIHWALTVGRLVVILTEIVALFAFVYRFSLDRQLIDLHDTIKNKQSYLKLLKDNEDTYRNLQSRIQLANNIMQNQTHSTQSLTDMVKMAPSDLLFSSISVSGDRISIEATIQSIRSLSRFIEKLQAHENIATVSLDHVENKTSSATIAVSITATLKKTSPEKL